MRFQYSTQLFCLLAAFLALAGCGAGTPSDSSRNLITNANDLSSSDLIEINVLIQDSNEQSLPDIFNAVTAQKITSETIVMKEDKSILISNALANGDNKAIQIVTFNQGDRGGLIKKIDENSLKYTPQENFFGVETFIYTVENAQKEKNLITVTLIVEAEQISPVVLAESFSTPEDGGITFANLLRGKRDIDVVNLSLDSFSQGNAGGTVQEISPNVLAYRPLNNFFGSEKFTYTVISANGELVSSDIEISVTPINDPPIANDDNFNAQEDQSIILSNLLDNDTDLDGNDLTITQISQGDKGGEVQQIADDVFRYTPQENFYGIETFYYTVNDENGGTSVGNVTLSVAPLNDLPITQEEEFTVLQGESILLTNLLQNDTDVDGDDLSISSFSQGSNGGIVSQTKNNVLRFVPKSDFYGLDYFTYTVSDRNGGTAMGYVTVQVESANDLPIVEDKNFELQEDETIVLTDLLPNNVDSNNFSITSFSQGIKGGQVSQLQNGTLRFTPKNNFYGEDSFSYTVSDGNDGVVGGNVTLQIMPINDIPVVTGEDISLQEDEAVLLPDLLQNDIDIDGDDLSISAFSQSVKGGLVSQINSETLRFTPSSNFYGTDSFSYTVSDGNGGTATGIVTIEVQSSNDLPVVFGETFNIQEDVAIILSGLLENDTDVDGDNLSIMSFSQGSNGGVVTRLTDGSLRFTPKNNFYGSASFSYTISDGNEGIAIGNVSIQVAPVNDAPIVTGESFSLKEDGVIVISGLLQNDVDVDGDSLSITSFSQGSNGGLIEEIDRDSFRYTPQSNIYGLESFNYTVEDGNGGVATGNVTLQVAAVNDDPVVIGESIELKEDESITLPNLLQNDSDADNTTLTISSVSQGDRGGQVTVLENNVLQYKPKTNFFGTETFFYRVSDDSGGVSEGRVIASITAVNDQPIANSDFISLTQFQEVDLALLNNDKGLGDGVSLSLASNPVFGVISADSTNNLLSYLPNGDYFGTDSFTYKLTDVDGETSIASVALDIECITNCTRIFKVSWNASASKNITNYKVYVGREASNFTEIFEIGNLTEFDYTATQKGEYFFAVSAVNIFGIESELAIAGAAIF